MINVPLDAKVECTDGMCGESVTVIVNPTTRAVTHFVVRNKSFPHPPERIVPVDLVVEVVSGVIRLSCTADELAGMEPFLETQYVETGVPAVYPGYPSSYELPYVTSQEGMQMPIEVERVPPGELAVHRGTRVDATDGHVGIVGELVVDPESGHVTHLVLQEGHLWDKTHITLPLSAIDFVHDDVVYLKFDKKAIEQLPAIPVTRRYARGEVEVELVARVFDNPDQASDALEFVEDLHRRQTIKILNAAVLVKREDGEAELQDTRDIDPGKGRLLGAITGGLIGLVGGPMGVVVGALAGAGTGSLAGKWIDLGFSDKFLAGLQEMMQPGTSALVVLVEHESVGKMSEALADVGGMVFQQSLTDEIVRRLVEEDEAET